MEKLFIPVVLGTARVERDSDRAALLVLRELQKRPDVEAELVDVRDYVGGAVTVPPWGEGGADENPTKWKAIASRADAFVLVVPEYNRGYPGELKILLDSLHDDYDKKPVATCGVSSGMFGGARVVAHLKPVLVELKMVPIRSAAHFVKVAEHVDEEGNTENAAVIKSLDGMFDELMWFARALKAARQNHEA